ncbi:hypothetical protein [Xanthomonas sp. NCPPB 2632]|uniref:hypothetical protein n=1 Tax=Xanthomonas sp. NCPPB 2632 TaxID=3240912 RepID=UPI00351754A2
MATAVSIDMPIQTARRANLKALIDQLEADDVSTRQAQAVYLGRSVTARKLQAMLDGSHIDSLFAGHIEHVLLKPRGWMSDPRTCQEIQMAGRMASTSSGRLFFCDAMAFDMGW